MSRNQTCVSGNCGRNASAALDVRALCREHFILACYSDLDEYGRLLEESRYRDTTTELVRRFLSECTRQTADLAQTTRDLDNLERARLLDILLRAGELSRHLRRSPRKIACMPVRLICDKLGHSWEEPTQTRVISRYGAAVECSHPVEVGDALMLSRLEGGMQVRARVAWRQPKSFDRNEIGLEFLQADNFWEIDWTTVDANLWQESTPKTVSH